MKDIHTHILHGIDDGAKTIEESIEILKIASQNGVTDIVLTPHYIKDSKYNANNKVKKEKFNELKKELKENKININIYLGNEVYINEESISLYKEISTINNSRYILIELPLTTKYPLLDEYLYKLKKKKLIPIIAHPERYTSYYKDYDFFNKLKEKGCLLQGNIGSIYGSYGRKSKKMLKKMLKKNMIHLLASDTHTKTTIYQKNIKKDLFKIVKDQKLVEEILETNPEKILKDIDII